MAFRLKAQHPVPDEIRRLAGERLAKAIESLEEGSAQGIHDARKRLKETRALLRLVRQPLGKRRFRELNARLRDSGRALSALRDVSAMIECWDELARQSPQRLARPDLQAVRDNLTARAEATPAPEAGHGELIDGLRQVVEGIPDWPLDSPGFALLRQGVRRSYGDGCDALAAVRDDPSDECLHEWRKRVKDHWYQTRLLQEAWPRLFKARKKALEALAEDLGDDHDLAMLQALMAQEPELFGAPETREEIAQAIAERRGRLQARALVLGARVHAEAPKALVKRWRRYWRVATRQGEAC